MRIKIFTTGGTIDKIYFDAKSSYQVGDPQITRLLEEANVTVDYSVESLMRKDSLEMTEADREQIVARVRSEASNHILITHGTDTMLETAAALQAVPDKTMVLTGAMQPARFHHTDAFFNVGFALAAVQLLPPGAYVAMNGRIFRPGEARKNVEARRFEPL
ncbi:MAG: asparaginase domain-containing protein [Gammaproteobacteria bacterium]